MTTALYSMREKIIGLGRLLYKRKQADAAYILLKSSNLFAFVPEAPGLAARSALLKEEISNYGKLNE